MGKSGGDRRKETGLTLGGLWACPVKPGLQRQRWRWMGTEESAAAIVPGRDVPGRAELLECGETDRMTRWGVEPREGMTDQLSPFGERAGNPVGAREVLATGLSGGLGVPILGRQSPRVAGGKSWLRGS